MSEDSTLPIANPTPSPARPPLPASIGPYKIVRILGEGGMGAVYEALQQKPSRTVALKVIRPGYLSPAALKRFHFEAEILGRLQHPHIATIFDAGTADTPLGTQPYFAMEFIAGQPLLAYAQSHNLSHRQRLELVIQIADAVHYAHTKGVIHRDLKPANILVTNSGQPKVLDFGLAKTTDSDIHATSAHTEIGALLGTLPYMAPEQTTGNPDEIDTRTDIYALGVVAYQLLSGQLPYNLSNRAIHAAIHIIQTEEPSRISTINKTLRGDIEVILAKALEKEKVRRYQSALDLASDIRRHLTDQPIAARPPSLLYRFSKFSRRNKPFMVGAAAVLIAVAAVLTFYFIQWNQQRTRIAYFRDFTFRYGVPEGIYPLSESERGHRNVVYRFETRAGKVIHVSKQNYAGILPADSDCQWTITYRENGKPLNVVISDNNGKERVRRTFNEDLSLIDLRNGDLPSPMEVTARSADKVVTDIVQHRVIYDSAGFVAEIHYRNAYGFPRANDQGYFGVHYERDAVGHPIRESYIDENGQPFLRSRGLAAIVRSYDVQGNQTGQHYLGADGNELFFPDKQFVPWAAKYDASGNQIEKTFLDLSGNPALNYNRYAREVAEFDEHGNQTHGRVFDAAGKPCMTREWISGVDTRYDQRGNVVERAYLGIDGRPCCNYFGYSIIRFRHDDRGNVATQSFFDVAGKPTSRDDHYARVVNRRDDRGDIVETAYFGIDDRPILCSSRYAIVRTRRDDRGRPFRQDFFDTEDQPTNQIGGYSSVVVRYDERGNVAELAYLDPRGNPCNTSSGYARLTQKYDDRGNPVQFAHFGPDGSPATTDAGYSSVTYKYDERGNNTEIAFFGPDGKLCLFNNQYATRRTKFDQRGFAIETAYFGVDGKPVPGPEGIARAVTQYNERGLSMQFAYFDVNGLPTPGPAGAARMVGRRDDAGHLVEMAYFGVDGQPVLSKDNFARMVNQFDDRGNISQTSYFGTDGKPIRHKAGFAHLLHKFDERGFLVYEAYLDENGKPCIAGPTVAARGYKYDERGNRIEETFFGLDGKPKNTYTGFSRLIRKFDGRGKQIEEAYFGIDDKPTFHKLLGYARFTKKFDDRNRLVEESYFAPDGSLTLRKDGSAARVTFQYNDRDEVIASIEFGANGLPLPAPIQVSDERSINASLNSEVTIEGRVRLVEIGRPSDRRCFIEFFDTDKSHFTVNYNPSVFLKDSPIATDPNAALAGATIRITGKLEGIAWMGTRMGFASPQSLKIIRPATQPATAPSSQPTTKSSSPIDSANTDAIRAALGQTVTVTGIIERFRPNAGTPVFFFRDVPENDLYLRIDPVLLPAIEKILGANPTAILPGRKIRVTAYLRFHHGRNELLLESPDQLHLEVP